MTHSVDGMIADILRREGGFVDDPDDPGGATNHGVTIHTMRRLRLDLDGDGDVDVADVRALPIAKAADIFKDEYFRAPRIHRLPIPLWPAVFDMQVNAGNRAVRLLQTLLTQCGYDVGAVDGLIGAKTIAGAEAAIRDLGPDTVVDGYGILRRDFYYRLADRRPASRKYARRRDGGKGGWITRAEEFMSPASRYTDAQHRRRVASWP